MSPEMTGLVGFLALLALLAIRVPVGIAMIAVSVVGYASILSPTAAFARLGSDAFTEASSYGLSVIPLFVFMGLLLAQAQLGKDLYSALDALLWRLRGGLAMATIGASAVFGSVSGSAVASASTMSVVAIPEMKRFRYDDGLAAACTAVGGTLGSLIPPSAVLVLYGILTEEPIGAILIGGFIPGVLTTVILMATAWVIVKRRPELAPDIDASVERARLVPALLKIWAVPAIFGLSMGGLYLGVFTPTESGAVGAILSLVYGLATRRLRWRTFWDAASQTVRVSAMIFLVVIAGKMFGFFLSVTRIPRGLGAWIADLDVAPFVIILIIFAIYFALGAMMDEIAILVIMTPMMYPIVIGLGYDGVWFGVVSIMMLLSGLVTPPVGLITFVVSGITGIPVGRVFRSVGPFLIVLSVAVIIVVLFPQVVLFLPEAMG
jgi:tripartite ATP-independent transporter DctM subunit